MKERSKLLVCVTADQEESHQRACICSTLVFEHLVDLGTTKLAAVIAYCDFTKKFLLDLVPTV